MVESAYVRAAKIKRQAEIVADANNAKANSEHPISEVRRAERDALEELAEDYEGESAEAVAAIELPSARLGEPPSADDEDGEE